MGCYNTYNFFIRQKEIITNLEKNKIIFNLDKL